MNNSESKVSRREAFDRLQTTADEWRLAQIESAACELLPRKHWAAKLATSPKVLHNWTSGGVLLYGPAGTGKSYTAAALAKTWYTNRINLGAYTARMLWLNVPMTVLEVLESFNTGTHHPAFTTAATVDLLILDDIGIEQPKEWVRHRLYAVLEARLNNDLDTIVTSNKTLPEISDSLGSQIASRLSELCATVSFDGLPDRRPGNAPSLKASDC